VTSQKSEGLNYLAA